MTLANLPRSSIRRVRGVHRAFNEWRAANPAVEAIMLNGESLTMEGTPPAL
jgi:hypothetical protein